MVLTTSMHAPSWRDYVRPYSMTVFVLYPLHKFRRTLSFSYWWIWHIYVLLSYHMFSEDYICIRHLSFCLFSLCLYAGFDSFFVWSDINHIYKTHQDEKLYKYVANFCKAKNGCGNLRDLRCHMKIYCILLYLLQYNNVIAIWFIFLYFLPLSLRWIWFLLCLIRY